MTIRRANTLLHHGKTELVIEGATQRHCVRSYARACRLGAEVVMKIDGVERATCSWRVGDSLIQVQGFANSQVSGECHKAAQAARAAFEAAH